MLVFVSLTTFVILHFEICIFKLKCGCSTMVSTSGCQSEYEGSIPFTRSKKMKNTRTLVLVFFIFFRLGKGNRTVRSETSWLSAESQRRRASMDATIEAFSADAGKEFVSVDEKKTQF